MYNLLMKLRLVWVPNGDRFCLLRIACTLHRANVIYRSKRTTNFVASWQTESWAVDSLKCERDADCVSNIQHASQFVHHFPPGRSSSLKRTWATLARPLIAQRAGAFIHHFSSPQCCFPSPMLTPQVNINHGLQLKGRETFSTFIFTANGVKMRNIFWLKGEAEAKSLHPLKCERVC